MKRKIKLPGTGKYIRYISVLFFMLLFLFPSEDALAASKKKSYKALVNEVSRMVKKNPVKMGKGLQSAGEYATKRLIVKTKSKKVNLKKFGAKSIIEGNDNLYFMQFDSISKTRTAAKKIKKLKNVRYVEPDRILGLTATEEYVPLSWGASKVGLTDLAQHVSSVTSGSVTVAVIDSGVSNHKFLKKRLLSGLDVFGPSKGKKDLVGHGTHIAGIIVDSTPGLNVKILPIRVCYDDPENIDMAVLALTVMRAVEDGAKVINLSVGAPGKSYVMEEYINKAIANDCVVVVSSGNSQASDIKPRSIEQLKFCPAYMKNVITVGATGEENTRAYFSNYGKALDVVAPGVDIYSTYLKGEYYYDSGTSMAAPYVTALAAQLRLLYPDKSAAQIKALITECAKDLGKKGWDPYYGYGLIQAPTEFTQISFKNEKVFLCAGDQKQLDYSLKNKYLSGGKTTWRSDNNNIAIVDSRGVVTAKKEGTVNISVSAYGKTASCTVTVLGKTQKLAALSLYNETLKNGKVLYGSKEYMSYFGLVYLDNNDIPELVVADTLQNHNSFTVLGVNGTILDVYGLFDISTDNHSIKSWYYPRTGLLFSTMKSEGNLSEQGVKYILDYQYAYLPKNGGKIVVNPEFPLSKSEWIYNNGTISERFLKQGSMNQKIGKEEYENELKKYIGSTLPVEIHLFGNTDANRKKVLGVF